MQKGGNKLNVLEKIIDYLLDIINIILFIWVAKDRYKKEKKRPTKKSKSKKPNPRGQPSRLPLGSFIIRHSCLKSNMDIFSLILSCLALIASIGTLTIFILNKRDEKKGKNNEDKHN